MLKLIHLPDRRAPSSEAQLEQLLQLSRAITLQQRSLLDRSLKRLLDLTVAVVALLLLAPLLLVLAALIKATSRGPVLFCQVRVGAGGKPFLFYKFRSMVSDAEELKASLKEHNEKSGPIFKIRVDPRVTGVGRWLRRYSLDELPQLLHIVRGEMSLVGPRPPVPSEVLSYAPWQLRRLSVMPGLTCIWQTSGRSDISFDDWMLMDLRYIDEWSLALDCKLLVKTIKTVITADGAY